MFWPPCLCHVYTMFSPPCLCHVYKYHVYTMFIPCLCHVYTMFIPCLYHVYTMFILCLYSLYGTPADHSLFMSYPVGTGCCEVVRLLLSANVLVDAGTGETTCPRLESLKWLVTNTTWADNNPCLSTVLCRTNVLYIIHISCVCICICIFYIVYYLIYGTYMIY